LSIWVTEAVMLAAARAVAAGGRTGTGPLGASGEDTPEPRLAAPANRVPLGAGKGGAGGEAAGAGAGAGAGLFVPPPSTEIDAVVALIAGVETSPAEDMAAWEGAVVAAVAVAVAGEAGGTGAGAGSLPPLLSSEFDAVVALASGVEPSLAVDTAAWEGAAVAASAGEGASAGAAAARGTIVNANGAGMVDDAPLTTGTCATLCTVTGGQSGRISPRVVDRAAVGNW
jgi:hypothetical protein